MDKITLSNLNTDLKYLLISFLITISIGIFTGLGYIYFTTNMQAPGTIDRYNGSECNEDEIPEDFPKPIENMILTTHNHVTSFAMISLLIGIIFYFSTIITSKEKIFLIIEPFVSTI